MLYLCELPGAGRNKACSGSQQHAAVWDGSGSRGEGTPLASGTEYHITARLYPMEYPVYELIPEVISNGF